MSLAESPLENTRTTFSSKLFRSAKECEQYILYYLKKRTGSHYLQVTETPHSWAQTILDAVDETVPARKSYDSATSILTFFTMPTDAHDSIQRWVFAQVLEWERNGQLSREEQSLIELGSGTTLKFQSGPRAGSIKEPGFFLRIFQQGLPTLVFESGWTESSEELRTDVDTLIVGGNGAIKRAITVNWEREQRCVSGFAKLFIATKRGPRLVKTEVVFPEPEDKPQGFSIKRKVLFGDDVVPDMNSDTYSSTSISYGNMRKGALRVWVSSLRECRQNFRRTGRHFYLPAFFHDWTVRVSRQDFFNLCVIDCNFCSGV